MQIWEVVVNYVRSNDRFGKLNEVEVNCRSRNRLKNIDKNEWDFE